MRRAPNWMDRRNKKPVSHQKKWGDCAPKRPVISGPGGSSDGVEPAPGCLQWISHAMPSKYCPDVTARVGDTCFAAIEAV